jgi:hypothetical protein
MDVRAKNIVDIVIFAFGNRGIAEELRGNSYFSVLGHSLFLNIRYDFFSDYLIAIVVFIFFSYLNVNFILLITMKINKLN